jgi:hypothetical protein
MGAACSKCEEEVRCVEDLPGKPELQRALGRKRVDGRIILRWMFKKQDGGVNWIDLAQIRIE